MNEEIEELKKQVEKRRELMETRTKTFMVEIEKFEKQISEKMELYNKNVFESIIDNVRTIKENVETWDLFEFEGINICRKNGIVIIYLSDKDSNIYEIYHEEGEFKCKDEIKTNDLSEDMKILLADLNTLLSYF